MNVAALLLAAMLGTAGLPTDAELSSVSVRLETQPPWPAGEAVTIVLAGDGASRVERTKLPCQPCKPVVQPITVSREVLLKVLNTALDSGFFDLQERYAMQPRFYVHGSHLILGGVITTDQDADTITIVIGAWSKRVMSDGNAPPAFRAVAQAIRAQVPQ